MPLNIETKPNLTHNFKLKILSANIPGWLVRYNLLELIYNIIKAYQKHGFPWFFLNISHFWSSLLVSPLHGIQCPHM